MTKVEKKYSITVFHRHTVSLKKNVVDLQQLSSTNKTMVLVKFRGEKQKNIIIYVLVEQGLTRRK